jgi:hypothetical protein
MGRVGNRGLDPALCAYAVCGDRPRAGTDWSTTIILAGRVASSAGATGHASCRSHRLLSQDREDKPAFPEKSGGRGRRTMGRADMMNAHRVAVAGETQRARRASGVLPARGSVGAHGRARSGRSDQGETPPVLGGVQAAHPARGSTRRAPLAGSSDSETPAAIEHRAAVLASGSTCRSRPTATETITLRRVSQTCWQAPLAVQVVATAEAPRTRGVALRGCATP